MNCVLVIYTVLQTMHMLCFLFYQAVVGTMDMVELSQFGGVESSDNSEPQSEVVLQGKEKHHGSEMWSKAETYW